MVCIRLDIAQALRILSGFMSNPHKEYLNYVNSVLRYFCYTFDYFFIYLNTKIMNNILYI